MSSPATWTCTSAHPEWQVRIATTEHAYDAEALAEKAPRHDGWPVARLAVMLELLRAKYTQNPVAKQVLLATGDARLIYVAVDSGYWVEGGARGSNWVGQLLEVVRSELAATDLGLCPAGEA